ncbi:hypothetical protein AMTRI_Chr13g91840 [Amborella trichopoda]
MKKTGKSDKVPEPSGTWPVLEHLPLLAKSRPPWRAFAYLANKYGPAFSIRTGSKQSLVVSSCELAKKSFTKNDKNFASRLLTTATKLLAYDYAVFVISPYGRVSELDACPSAVKVDLHKQLDHMMLNKMLRMVAGRRFPNGIEDRETRQFQRLVKELVCLLENMFLLDVFPFLGLLGQTRAMKRVWRDLDSLLE